MNRFKNLKLNEIKNQLVVLIFCLIFLLLFLFIINFFSNRNINQDLHTINQNHASLAIQMEKLHYSLQEIAEGETVANFETQIEDLQNTVSNLNNQEFRNKMDTLLLSLHELNSLPDTDEAANTLANLENLQQNQKNILDQKIENIGNLVKAQNRINLISLLLTIAFVLIFGIYIRKSLIKSLKRPTKLMQNLSKGKLPENIKPTGNEFNELIILANQLVDNLRTASNFALNIGQGKFEDNYQPSTEDDILGNALINMRDQLLKVDQESQKRNWANEGYAKFGDILRKQTDDIQDFGFSIISGLVKYIEGNQGAIYVVQEDSENEQEQVLNRIGTYAYGRHKYVEDIIKPGSGLVGQAFLEQETIHMIDIPDDYIKITSGLGDAPPRSLIIVPMKFNDQIYGVMEIASFNKFQKHEVDFLETIAESIASTISNVRINEQTVKLLSETQEQAEQLRTQEEEMRQNMEELSATHEQVERLKLEEERKNKEMIAKIEDYKNMLMRIIDNVPGKIFLKDHEGRLILLNQAVANAYNTTVDKLLGTTDFDFFSFEIASAYRKTEVEIIETNKPQHIPEEIFKDQEGKIHILDTLKMPFKISGDDKIGLLGVQTDITEIKSMEKKLKEQKEEMQKEIDALKEQIKKNETNTTNI